LINDPDSILTFFRTLHEQTKDMLAIKDSTYAE